MDRGRRDQQVHERGAEAYVNRARSRPGRDGQLGGEQERDDVRRGAPAGPPQERGEQGDEEVGGHHLPGPPGLEGIGRIHTRACGCGRRRGRSSREVRAGRPRPRGAGPRGGTSRVNSTTPPASTTAATSARPGPVGTCRLPRCGRPGRRRRPRWSRRAHARRRTALARARSSPPWSTGTSSQSPGPGRERGPVRTRLRPGLRLAPASVVGVPVARSETVARCARRRAAARRKNINGKISSQNGASVSALSRTSTAMTGSSGKRRRGASKRARGRACTGGYVACGRGRSLNSTARSARVRAVQMASRRSSYSSWSRRPRRSGRPGRPSALAIAVGDPRPGVAHRFPLVPPVGEDAVETTPRVDEDVERCLLLLVRALGGQLPHRAHDLADLALDVGLAGRLVAAHRLLRGAGEGRPDRRELVGVRLGPLGTGVGQPDGAATALVVGLHEALVLQLLDGRVDRAGGGAPLAVAELGDLLDHLVAVDRLLGGAGAVQHVDDRGADVAAADLRAPLRCGRLGGADEPEDVAEPRRRTAGATSVARAVPVVLGPVRPGQECPMIVLPRVST